MITPRIIDINAYLDAFYGAKASDKIGETELNEIVLNSMSNGCTRQAYMQGFDFEYITKTICKCV